MPNQGSNDRPSPAEDNSGSGESEDGLAPESPEVGPATGPDGLGVDDSAANGPPPQDPEPDDEPSAYQGHEVLPPPAFTSGRYQFSSVPPGPRPPDPILPFVAPPVPRRRRSDWPVLAIALVIAAVVLAVCCVAGFVLYGDKGPFFK